MSDGFYYKEIEPCKVDMKIRDLAGKVLDYCRAALGLCDNVKIQWVRAADPESAQLDESFVKLEKVLRRMIGDFLDPEIQYRKEDLEFSGQMGSKSWLREKILIRSDIPKREVLLTIAHELKHLADFGPNGKYRPPFLAEEKGVAEKRAEDFARTIITRMEILGLL